jgi:transposase-like protein
MARRSQWSIADRERIARFADGHSAYAAARRYGVHESTVKAWRAKLRRGEPFFPGIPDMMEALYDSQGR